MKSFQEFINESEEDWKNWDAIESLSYQQCQFIEDTLGENPVFINNHDNIDDFSILRNVIAGTEIVDRVDGIGSMINRYEVVPEFNIILIRPTNPTRWFAVRKKDLANLKLADGDLDQWTILNLFNDF